MEDRRPADVAVVESYCEQEGMRKGVAEVRGEVRGVDTLKAMSALGTGISDADR